GKSQLIPFVIELLKHNNLIYGEYAEPFAGGSGIAMHLLLEGYVDKVYLNDLDPAIYSFWLSVLNHTDEICRLIMETDITIDEWHKQREIFRGGSNSTSEIVFGFSTLFLNRTNRSGIIKGGVIGGLGQNGNYKLDCRFNKSDLIRKIRRIASYRTQINLSQLDAVEFIQSVVPNTSPNTLVNLDPPYFGKGPELYTNFYRPEDHADLAEAVRSIQRHWMVTYDDAPEIRELYNNFSTYTSNLNYSAQLKRVGTELLVLGPSLTPHQSSNLAPLSDSGKPIAIAA
ncbi:MAG TPA: DNA adenine methylase, partial [Gallionella sp.]